MEMFLVGLVFLGLCEGTIYIAMIMLYDRDHLSIAIVRYFVKPCMQMYNFVCIHYVRLFLFQSA